MRQSLTCSVRRTAFLPSSRRGAFTVSFFFFLVNMESRNAGPLKASAVFTRLDELFCRRKKAGLVQKLGLCKNRGLETRLLAQCGPRSAVNKIPAARKETKASSQAKSQACSANFLQLQIARSRFRLGVVLF